MLPFHVRGFRELFRSLVYVMSSENIIDIHIVSVKMYI
jgi:hypothetical protein